VCYYIIITFWCYYRPTVTYKKIWLVTQLIGATELPVIPSALHPATLSSISLLGFCYYKIICYIEIISQTGQPSYLRSLLSFPSHRCTRSSSRIALSRTSLTSRLKIANRSYYHSAPVLWNNLPSDLLIAHHVTMSPILNSLVSDISTSLFLKKLKTYLFHSSFPPQSVFT